MTNFEKYKVEILGITKYSAYSQVAIKDGKPVLCEDAVCASCELNDESDLGNCVLEFMEWAYEDDGDWRDCGDCKHYNEGDTADSCERCKRYYLDRFEAKLRKRGLEIQPCAIEGENFQCRDKCEPCSECVRAYWKQEVE